MSAHSTIEPFLREAGVTQDEVGAALGISGSAINHKLAGRRGWKQDEITNLLAFLSRRLRRRVTYEQVFRPGKVPA